MTNIYDNLHGYIKVDEWALKIIDTNEFQRLRKIKQLGLVYNVFAGASHNRFEHSLGVYHLAEKYINFLKVNNNYFTKQDIKNIKTAALIHDIGHGPYSHLFDELFNSCHEERSLAIFKIMNDKYKLNYSTKDIDYISNMINPDDTFFSKYPYENRFYLFEIVSNKNGIDIDRMDYLERDIKMTGLTYGIETHEIMIHSKISDNHIIYKDRCSLIIENFFAVRYILYKRVYTHTTVRAIELMVKDMLLEINNEIDIEKEYLSDMNKFILLNDSILDSFIFKDNSKVIEIMSRLNERKLYKLCDNMNNINLNIRFVLDKSVIKYHSKLFPIFESTDMTHEIEAKLSAHKNEINYNIYKKNI